MRLYVDVCVCVFVDERNIVFTVNNGWSNYMNRIDKPNLKLKNGMRNTTTSRSRTNQMKIQVDW